MTNAAHETSRPPTKIITATVIGNFTEWFDFAVYGAVAVILGKLFFPSGNATAELLASLSVFGVAFLFRPVGGALLGFIGDKYGRKSALTLAVVGISVATTFIGLLPTQASIGIWAPVLLILLRVVQGLSAGGEWTSASAYLAEYAPVNRRGLWVSLVSVSGALAIVCGNLLVLALETSIGADAMMDWGWRVPFLLGAPLGLVGIYMRLRLQETPVYQELQSNESVSSSPLRDAFTAQKRNLVLAFFCASIMGVGFYYFATYFVNALTKQGEMSRPSILGSIAAAMIVYAALCPVVGRISDQIGRRRLFIAGCLGHLVFAIPIFKLVTSGDWRLVLLGLILFGIPQSALNVMGSIALIELFPPRTRSSGAAVGYGLGAGPIAGTGPLIAAALVSRTGNPVAAAYYLMGIALVVAVVVAALLPETFKRSLFADDELPPGTADKEHIGTANKVES